MFNSSHTHKLLSFLGILFSFFIMHACSTGPEKATRVFLIGIDGMGISGFEQATTPNLDMLVRTGAISMKTRGVMPTVSGPNWGSHLLGAGPEQHGITSNGWTVDNHSVEATLTDSEGYFPSVFSLIREQMPDATTGFFYDWDALANFYNPAGISRSEFSRSFDETFEKATPWILENDPEFTFLYIGHPDEEGHAHQWGSREYIQALEDVDAALGQFFKTLQEADMFEDAHFIVVTDHGGVGYGHGGLSMEEIEIPWIISGPGIIRDRVISQPGDVFNTAATIAYLLGLEQPWEWLGRPNYGAFEGHKDSRVNTVAYVPQPVSSIESGLYPESEAVVLQVPDPSVKIRYTLDGSEPTPTSFIYKSQILLQKSSELNAAGFLDDHRSRITRIQFRKVKQAGNILLTNAPEEKYSGSGMFTLIDLQLGSNDYSDGKWLGFRGTDLEATLIFAEQQEVSKVTVGILNNPGSWIFAPVEVDVLASVNGQDYSSIGKLTKNQVNERLKNGRMELTVKNTPAKTRFLKVVAKSIGECPQGHAGAGEAAWLFVDEIIVE